METICREEIKQNVYESYTKLTDVKTMACGSEIDAYCCGIRPIILETGSVGLGDSDGGVYPKTNIAKRGLKWMKKIDFRKVFSILRGKNGQKAEGLPYGSELTPLPAVLSNKFRALYLWNGLDPLTNSTVVNYFLSKI